MLNDISTAICDLIACFNNHNIKYLIGGSVSSSINGIYRTTNDIDVLLENLSNQSPIVIRDLKKKFLVDEEALIRHHQDNKAYNIFHEETALKIDLFPKYSEFHHIQLTRAISVKPPSSPCSFNIASAEDTILAKLVWLKKSASERQVSDIIGVVSLNLHHLDFQYLRYWAEKLDVQSSLEGFLK